MLEQEWVQRLQDIGGSHPDANMYTRCFAGVFVVGSYE